MAEISTALVSALREEFRQLGAQLRRELRDELQRRPAEMPSRPSSKQEILQRDTTVASTLVGPTSSYSEGLGGSASIIFTKPLQAIRPLISDFTQDFQSWSSSKPLSSAQNKVRFRRYLNELEMQGMSPPDSHITKYDDTQDGDHDDEDELRKNADSVSVYSIDAKCDPQALPGQIPEDEEHAHECQPAGSDRRKRRRKRKETSGQKALGIVNKANIDQERGQQLKESTTYASARRNAWRVVTHPFFEVLSLIFITLNAIQIGVTTNYMATEQRTDEPSIARILELFFCIIFVSELVLKLVAWHRNFFIMYGWAWNVFDLAVVSLQVLEQFFQFILGHELEHEGALLRLVRSLRLLRVVRVLRIMRFTEDLQLLVTCILHSSKGFFWSLVLLFLMTYVAGIYLCQVSTNAILTQNLTPSEKKEFTDIYSSVPLSILSVLQGLLGGLDWRELVHPIKEHVSPLGPFISVIVVFFILFLILVVLNVITGNFVQAALDGAQEIKEIHRFNQARKFFSALDIDSTGEITFEEITSHLETSVVQDFFEEMDVDVSEAQSLFKLIDLDQSGLIDCEEFLLGCMRLQGPAKATDLLLVTSDIRTAFEKQWLAFEALEKHLCQISSALCCVHSSVTTASTV